jgi:hypothetical protein
VRALWLLALLCLCLARTAHAQPSDEDRAAAQLLFDEGQQLKKKGEHAAACEKFAASQSLDPAVGTQLNLADCYEKIGRTASAWVNFVEVSKHDEAGAKRAKYARQHAEALAPRLTKLQIQIEEPVDGLELKRDGVLVPQKTWGIAVPVDPGDHEIVAVAPGKERWSRTVEVGGEGETITVTVPALADAAGSGAPEPIEPDEPEAAEPAAGGPGGQTIAGGVLLGLGGAGVLVAAVLTGIAHSKYGESVDHCRPDDTTQCDQEGVDLRGEAQSLQKGYAATFGLGGALLLTGIIVLATAPSDADPEEKAWRLLPVAGPRGAGILATGSF